MRKLVFAAALIGAALGAATTASAADNSFKCAWMPVADEPAGIKDLRTLLSASDPLNDPSKLNAAIDGLRKQGASRAIVIDNLISAYCPVVASNKALSNAQKTARIQRFATTVTRVVYQFENADQILLSVPFPPDVVDAITARAAAAKVSPQEWVATSVEQSLATSK